MHQVKQNRIVKDKTALTAKFRSKSDTTICQQEHYNVISSKHTTDLNTHTAILLQRELWNGKLISTYSNGCEVTSI